MLSVNIVSETAIGSQDAGSRNRREAIQERQSLFTRSWRVQIGAYHSLTAIASQMRSIAGISTWLPGRWPLTRIENASVLPVAVVR